MSLIVVVECDGTGIQQYGFLTVSQRKKNGQTTTVERHVSVDVQKNVRGTYPDAKSAHPGKVALCRLCIVPGNTFLRYKLRNKPGHPTMTQCMGSDLDV